jgi:hypothetical protein
MSTLLDALAAWADTPINEHGTPHVNHPLDFTPAEQSEFLELVRQPRLVPADEQVAKLKEIVSRRSK